MNNIREFREKIGINQQLFAHKIGVKQATVSRWESGKIAPKFEKIPQIARILDCTIDDIFQK